MTLKHNDQLETLHPSIDPDKLNRIFTCLVDARDSSKETLSVHMATTSMEARRNRYIADMLEQEVRRLNSLIEYLSGKGAVQVSPFFD
jgi:hypothetical protein